MCWIVTWIVVTTFMVACPPPTPTYDEFGRRVGWSSFTNAIPAVACFDTERTPHERHFISYEEAEEFVKRGEESCKQPLIPWYYAPNGCDLRDFKIKQLDNDEPCIVVVDPRSAFVK